MLHNFQSKSSTLSPMKKANKNFKVHKTYQQNDINPLHALAVINAKNLYTAQTNISFHNFPSLKPMSKYIVPT